MRCSYRYKDCKQTYSKFPFVIRNRELIGQKDPIYNKHIDIGNIILSKFMYKPDFVGQVDAATGEKNTFKQMREKSIKCALWLQKMKIKSNDVITVCTHNQLDAYIPYLATLYIGAILNPWPKQKKAIKSNAIHFLTRVTPKVIFVDNDNAIMIQAAVKEMKISPKIVVFGNNEFDEFESLELILRKKFNPIDINTFSCVKKNSRDTAILLLSCSTTGFLKDIKVPYTIFIASWNQIPIRHSCNYIGLWFESLDWIISLILIVHAIILGVKVIKSSKFDDEHHLCQIIQKYKVNWIFLETNMCNRLSKFDTFREYDISSLRSVIFGGLTILRNVHASLIQSLPNVSIIQVYCLPETGFIAYQRNTGLIGSSGYVGRNVRLLITDCTTQKRLRPYITGVIWCQTWSIMNGYYKDSRHTRNVIDYNGWFRSEDVGYYDEQGNIFVIDRVKQLIRYRYLTYISPAEIEIKLQCHPAVSEVAVVPLPHDFDNFHLMAFIVLVPGSQAVELNNFIKETFVDLHYLHTYFLSQLPHIDDQIIDRKNLSLVAEYYAK